MAMNLNFFSSRCRLLRTPVRNDSIIVIIIIIIIIMQKDVQFKSVPVLFLESRLPLFFCVCFIRWKSSFFVVFVFPRSAR